MRNQLLRLAVCFCAFGALKPARAINVSIDYRYDVGGFFSQATPNGMQARATLDAAAAFFSNIIDDSLSAIPVPSGGNVWRQIIMHPGTGQENYSISSAPTAAQDPLTATQGVANEFRNIQIANNNFLIYAGGTSLTSAGIGGTSFASYGTPTFNNLIAQRGKLPQKYASWGGFVSFDNDGGTNWHLDYTQPVAAGKVDLYSTALHEIGHVLGLNTGNSVWMTKQSGAEFQGTAALGAWKADDPSAPPAATGIPTVSASDFHWKNNPPGQPQTPSVRSKVVGTLQLQEVAMDPVILAGTRKRFTNVDTKALIDIGWTIPSSVFNVAPPAQGDFNGDGQINGGDLAVWKSSFRMNTGANADGDGDTDGADFLIWQRKIGTGASAAVPEPNAIALVTLGGFLLRALFMRGGAGRARSLRRFQGAHLGGVANPFGNTPSRGRLAAAQNSAAAGSAAHRAHLRGELRSASAGHLLGFHQSARYQEPRAAVAELRNPASQPRFDLPTSNDSGRESAFADFFGG
jgi:hypothetical protein